MEMKDGNPTIFVIMGFGFSLATLGVQQILLMPDLTRATIYGLIVGSLAEFIGGIWLFVKKDTYMGSVGTTFGAWLIGYFLFSTQGVQMKLFSPLSSALYCFALIPPVILLTYPAIKFKARELTFVFFLLIGVLLFLGIGNISYANAKIFLRIGGILSLGTALLLWHIGWNFIKQMVHELMESN